MGAKLPEPRQSSCGHSCSEPTCGKTEAVSLFYFYVKDYFIFMSEIW